MADEFDVEAMLEAPYKEKVTLEVDIDVGFIFCLYVYVNSTMNFLAVLLTIC